MTKPGPLAAKLGSAYARFLRGEPAALVAMLADDVVYYLPGRHLGGGVLRGRQAVLERLVAAARWCNPPPHATLLDFVGAGFLVSSLERFAAERPGARVDQMAVVVWRFAPGGDDRCIEIRSQFEDQAAMDSFWSPFVPTGTLEAELDAYFTKYAQLFDAGDVESIARCYAIPCYLVRSGSVAIVRSNEALRETLRALVASHERAGYGRATFSALSLVARDEGLVLAVVPWTVHARSGQVMWRFDVAYNLLRRDAAWMIVAATTYAA